ncbi:hypothetical protein Mycch_3846 [Mycolicibacterium chubuense NBB4]|uniref:DUF305 domain-containing protein n=1 Tax=Mycolicibacterium chubuense (strain NBB4) TaxID=710421 RepID=I4BMR5_MYCCN|nr:DUF305 domain-containing protein [Mycolicibacterium chubuense]AFM18572.1 hypothetical protein Mycch_3846 [Mycolicibacterium chubuense NBB4]
MMSKRGVLAGAGAVGATLALLLTGCSSSSNDANSGSAGHQHEPTSQPAEGATAHNDADVSFATNMIPHHEQAIVMSDIILGKQGIDQRVVALANQIKAAQGPEITTMRQWLTDWGTPASGHEGHDMGGGMHGAMGMMTDQQLQQLRDAQGVDAARQFLSGMIAHHEGAVTMAQTEVGSGRSAPAVSLAQNVIKTQQREIDEMKQILGSL